MHFNGLFQQPCPLHSMDSPGQTVTLKSKKFEMDFFLNDI
jgi:hypothetical protein